MANWGSLGAGTTVSEFAAGSTTPTKTLTGLNGPIALAFDSSGNLYVANDGDGSGTTVSEFAPGSTTPTKTLSGLSSPRALAFDSSGNLYVVNQGGNTVSEFAVGSSTPTKTLTGLNGPIALAFDSSGNLYVVNEGANTVSEFTPGSSTPTATLTGLDNPNALAFDSSGNLYVVNNGNNGPESGTGTTVSKFTPTDLATPTAGGVVIRSSLSSLPITIGGTTTAPTGVSLTSAELAQISTTAGGTVTIGDSAQAGNVTFTTATSATTPGASTVVVQDPTGLGQIILDDGNGSGTALNGNGGTIRLNAGIGGIVAASANNTAAEIATTAATVTLNTSGPIGTSSNRIQFADDANTAQQNVIVGSTNEPTSVFLDGLGSLTLGSIEGGTANPQIDITARTNLVVAAGAMVDSGVSTLSLGADLNADGTGNDGVGTLSIDAGATVTSTNPTASTITLRGANIDIATGANPAVVGASRQLSTTPTKTRTGLNDPFALAFDSSGNLYVANYGGTTVSEFAPGSITATVTLTGLSEPEALVFDSSGNLYVANDGIGDGTTVSEFAPGSTTPSATLTGLTDPWAPAFDSSGNLFVANWNSGTVSEFAPGSTMPTKTLTGLSCPCALAFDSSGNLYVANADAGTVSEFAPGSTTPTATLTEVDWPRALAFDSSGNLFVANSGNGAGTTVSEFARGSTTPTKTLTGLNDPVALAFDSSGNLYVANMGVGGGGTTVSEFAPGSTTATATLSGLWAPSDLAFDTAGDLYVANWGWGGIVSEFAPGNTPTAGGVVIRSSLPSLPIAIGGTTTAPTGVSLTSAELAQIYTTAGGTLTVGDSSQTGNITFTTATPATTPGASTVVVQDASSPGQIILDDGAGTGTAVAGNGGTVALTPGASGIEAVVGAAADPWLVTNGFTIPTGTNLTLDLNFAPSPGTQLTIIDNTAATGTAISGTFANLPQGGTISASYGGATYIFTANYSGGDGNDLVLTWKATPTVTPNSPVNITYGTPLADGQLTGTATWTVNGKAEPVDGVFSYTTTGGTVLSAGDGQTENVTFTPTDTTDYTTATGTVTVDVAKATPTVSVSGPVTIAYGTALVDGQLTGTATSTVNGSPVSVAGVFSYTTAGGTVLSAGDGQTENVTFTPTDTTDYTTATGTVTVDVAKATPTLTLSGPVNITYGTALADGQLTGTATCTVNGKAERVAGVFSYTTAGGTVLSAGDGQTENVTFTPTDTTDYTTATGTVTVDVAKATPTFTLSGPVNITYGTALADGQLTGTATCTVNGKAERVAGVFSYTTAGGTVLSAGDGQTENVTFTPTDTTDYTTATGTVTVDVAKATPTVSVSDAGGTFNGSAFAATATVAGVDGAPDRSLEGVSPTLLYYTGSDTSGTGSASAPVTAGTYTVVASFAGSADYAAAQSQPVTFTITKAAPTVTVTDAGGTYNGLPYAVTNADVTGVPSDGAIASFGDPSLSYTYYAEPANTALAGAPTNAGTYAVVATFAGNSNYAATSSAPVDFTIGKATPMVTATDAGGVYSGSPFLATALINDVSSLEGVTPAVTYYAGDLTAAQIASATPLASARARRGRIRSRALSPGAQIMPRPAARRWTSRSAKPHRR